MGTKRYTAAIRTLGTAGEKYIRLLDSLNSQTIRPEAITVYIAAGYEIPQGTPGNERYVHVKKGMVAQRALDYQEIDTEYILFLDDDLYLSPGAVEEFFDALDSTGADVVSPDVYHNSDRSSAGKAMMLLSGRMRPRRDDGVWGYKVMRNGGYSYNESPSKKIYFSQTNAGACFLCRKEDFLKIHFEDEGWVDEVPYAMGEDQTMYYKMYLNGLKIITLYNDSVVHLDASSSVSSDDKEKLRIYADFRFKTIFWHRFILTPEKRILMKIWDVCCIGYVVAFTLMISILKVRPDIFKLKYNAIKNAMIYIRGNEYKALPKIN